MQKSTAVKSAETLLKSIILILVLMFLSSCKCDEEPLITSFSIEEPSPSVMGTINQLDHSIKLTLAESTDISKLTPTIQVSDPLCHTLFPPSGQEQDFSSPVYYEVKNEAGASKQYEVIVEFSKTHCYSSDTVAIQWSDGSEMPVPVGWGACAVLDGKIYVLGGATENMILSDILQVYDPATDQWDLSRSRPLYSRFAHGASVVDGKIYAFGGALTYPGPVYDNIQVYDPAENVWKDHGTMPRARAAFATVAYEGKIYLMGGETNEPTAKAEILDLVEVYDPADNSWEEKTPLKIGRSSLSTCVVDGKIFCVGGCLLDHASPGSTTVEVYDPEADCVCPATAMQFTRYTSASAVVAGKIYILGGCNDANYYTYSNKTEIGIAQFD